MSKPPKLPVTILGASASMPKAPWLSGGVHHRDGGAGVLSFLGKPSEGRCSSIEEAVIR